MSTNSMLEKLRGAFKKSEQTNGPSNYYRFWDMPMNETAVIRFLPDKNQDNPLGFLQEKLTHTLEINGEKKTIPCLRQYGQDCPICGVSQAYYKKGDKTSGKKFWVSKQHIAQIIVIKDPLLYTEGETSATGQYRIIGMGFQLTNIIKDSFESDELEEVPYAFEGGYDFIIKKTQQGEYATYAVGTKFKAKPRDLTEEELAVYEAHAVDLSTLLPAEPSLEKVQAMLESALTGKSYEEEDNQLDEVDDEENPLITTNKVSKTTSKPKPTPVASSVDDEDDDAEAQAILDRIKNNRRSKV